MPAPWRASAFPPKPPLGGPLDVHRSPPLCDVCAGRCAASQVLTTAYQSAGSTINRHFCCRQWTKKSRPVPERLNHFHLQQRIERSIALRNRGGGWPTPSENPLFSSAQEELGQVVVLQAPTLFHFFARIWQVPKGDHPGLDLLPVFTSITSRLSPVPSSRSQS